MSSNDIADWFRRIPTMSKYWFTGSIVMPLLGKLGVVSIMTMLLDYSLVVHKFQVQSALPLGHMVSGIPDLPSLRKKKVKLSFLYFTFVVFFLYFEVEQSCCCWKYSHANGRKYAKVAENAGTLNSCYFCTKLWTNVAVPMNHLDLVLRDRLVREPTTKQRLKMPCCASMQFQKSFLQELTEWSSLPDSITSLALEPLFRSQAVCYIVPVGMHTLLAQCPAGVWQLSSRSRIQIRSCTTVQNLLKWLKI